MRWMFLGVAVCGFASLWSVVPTPVLFVAFLVMFANFATFCVLYDRPQHRARLRITAELRRLNPNTDVAQRLATAAISPSGADRHLGLGPMTIANLATGFAAGGLLIWGIALRVF